MKLPECCKQYRSRIVSGKICLHYWANEMVKRTKIPPQETERSMEHTRFGKVWRPLHHLIQLVVLPYCQFECGVVGPSGLLWSATFDTSLLGINLLIVWWWVYPWLVLTFLFYLDILIIAKMPSSKNMCPSLYDTARIRFVLLFLLASLVYHYQYVVKRAWGMWSWWFVAPVRMSDRRKRQSGWNGS